MNRDSDLFKTLLILTIVCLVVDFNSGVTLDEISFQLRQPFEAKNWHFLVLLMGVYLSRGK